jgi:uncharacterized protein (UPF0332 family)
MTDVIDDLGDAVDGLEDGLDELNGEGLSKQIKTAYRLEARIESLNKSLQRMNNAGYNTSELDDYLSKAQSLLSQIEEKVREGDEEAAEELIKDVESLVEQVQGLIKKLQRNSINASQVTETSRGRKNKSGRLDGDGEDGNLTVSTVSDSDELSEELGELESVLSRIEEWFANSSTSGDNTTDIEILVEDAKAFIEDAKALADESPDEAKELMKAAEEVLDEAIDLIEGMTGTESNVSVANFEPEDDEDSSNPDDGALPDIFGSQPRALGNY